MVRREERNRLVAPVVHPASRGILRVELKNRQELHRCDAKILKVGNLFNQPCIGPAPGGGDTGVGMSREAADVKLVDHRFGERPVQGDVSLPVILAGIGHHALHCHRRVVAWLACGRAVVLVGNRDGETIGVDEQLLGIESKRPFRRERSMRAIAIELAGPEARNKGVPVVIRPMRLRIERDDA